MDQLIQQYEEERYHILGFWMKFHGSAPPVVTDDIYTGRLKLRSKSRAWKTHLCKLTPEFLYSCSVLLIQEHTGAPKKQACIRWKRVEPFTEENGAETRFGFRLIRGKNYRDFYAESAEQLEEWLDQLSRVSIMSDLENDFEMGEEIGRGNYAKVYLARSVQDQQKVAVKTIPKEGIVKCSRNVQAIINEVNLMKRLSHSRILKLIGIYESEENLHLVLEYVGGGDLFQRLTKKGKYSEAKAAVFMKNLLEAINYMHSRGVVHRDLKPENILLVSGSEGVEFKIADFGLAAEYHSGESLSLRCGSPGYVAPEILEKHNYDTKVDVFSVGIIMYIL